MTLELLSNLKYLAVNFADEIRSTFFSLIDFGVPVDPDVSTVI